ncbi:hypothetical protein DCAR_0310326 [Daucus carota subsp. sativus]|uniref:Uncharacterized protein n=1 Tax=Daucus carota subsp. sativus TaxID=79200 RepID=A0A165ZSN3_DAUCS|nr:hypothetical protein DCAR_0310326 [Daucus carota subsp. sativus]
MMCYDTSLNCNACLSPPHKRQRLEKDAVIAIHDGEYHAREFLFKKVLAKSDVGSRSYVFTGAWNKFVKAYELQAGDSVLFYKNYSGDECFFGIEVRYAGARNIVGSVTKNLNNVEEFMNDDTIRVKEEREVSASEPKEKDFQLFGVRIKRASTDFQGGRSIDVIKEEEDYLVHKADCRRVKEEEEEFEGLKVDLNLSL